MTNIMNAVLLSDAEMGLVVGGILCNAPQDWELARYGLDRVVRYSSRGYRDTFYKTYRGIDKDGNEIWKTVGSEDMLGYVRGILGKNSRLYKRLNAEWRDLGFLEYGW